MWLPYRSGYAFGLAFPVDFLNPSAVSVVAHTWFLVFSYAWRKLCMSVASYALQRGLVFRFGSHLSSLATHKVSISDSGAVVICPFSKDHRNTPVHTYLIYFSTEIISIRHILSNVLLSSPPTMRLPDTHCFLP